VANAAGILAVAEPASLQRSVDLCTDKAAARFAMLLSGAAAAEARDEDAGSLARFLRPGEIAKTARIKLQPGRVFLQLQRSSFGQKGRRLCRHEAPEAVSARPANGGAIEPLPELGRCPAGAGVERRWWRGVRPGQQA